MLDLRYETELFQFARSHFLIHLIIYFFGDFGLRCENLSHISNLISHIYISMPTKRSINLIPMNGTNTPPKP